MADVISIELGKEIDMLKVLIGKRLENHVANLDKEFNYLYDSSWFSDDVVKQIVKDIDKCDVLSENCIDSPVLGQIPPDMLSGGCKGLILLYKGVLEENGYHTDMEYFGPNCEEWISRIGEMRDFSMSCETYDLAFECGIRGICLNDGEYFANDKEWREEVLYWMRRG